MGAHSAPLILVSPTLTERPWAQQSTSSPVLSSLSSLSSLLNLFPSQLFNYFAIATADYYVIQLFSPLYPILETSNNPVAQSPSHPVAQSLSQWQPQSQKRPDCRHNTQLPLYCITGCFWQMKRTTEGNFHVDRSAHLPEPIHSACVFV